MHIPSYELFPIAIKNYACAFHACLTSYLGQTVSIASIRAPYTTIATLKY